MQSDDGCRMSRRGFTARLAAKRRLVGERIRRGLISKWIGRRLISERIGRWLITEWIGRRLVSEWIGGRLVEERIRVGLVGEWVGHALIELRHRGVDAPEMRKQRADVLDSLS